ncbi:MAG TPA: sirohydrochlorin cobaltochelatase [Desulfobacterales bacterium]|nr:sirohydrochlorin cobaltochelatase [Desulfobacterales bacterium]
MYFTMKKAIIPWIMLVVMLASGSLMASGKTVKNDGDTAIVIASFGTTVPSAVTAIINIIDQTKAAYPNTEVRVTFTSNIIRSVWNKRQADAQKWLDDGIPKEILYVKNIISTIGDLREEGFRNIIVQPTHMFYMEQSQDLKSYVDGLASIKTTKDKWRPFDKLVMGRPALGMPGDRYDYHKDMETAVATLAKDAALARKEGAILIYMGHGNEHWSTGIYAETQKKMRETYPEVSTFIGVVEGMPGIDDFLSHLQYAKTKKIILKPFMIVAGDHAKNDMAGPEADSWLSILTKEGYDVQPILKGLGSNDEFANIFVAHIKDTADEHGIALK